MCCRPRWVFKPQGPISACGQCIISGRTGANKASLGLTSQRSFSGIIFPAYPPVLTTKVITQGPPNNGKGEKKEKRKLSGIENPTPHDSFFKHSALWAHPKLVYINSIHVPRDSLFPRLARLGALPFGNILALKKMSLILLILMLFFK